MLCFHLFKWPLPLGMEESTVLGLGSIPSSYSCSNPLTVLCCCPLWAQNLDSVEPSKLVTRQGQGFSVTICSPTGPEGTTVVYVPLCTSCRVFSPAPKDCDQPHSHWVFLSVWVVGFPFCAAGSWSLPSFSGHSLVTLPFVTEHQQGYISGRWLFLSQPYPSALCSE